LEKIPKMGGTKPSLLENTPDTSHVQHLRGTDKKPDLKLFSFQ